MSVKKVHFADTIKVDSTSYLSQQDKAIVDIAEKKCDEVAYLSGYYPSSALKDRFIKEAVISKDVK